MGPGFDVPGRPTTRPGGGTRPGQDGSGQQFRPGDDTRPSRPGQDGGGQQFRPGDNTRPSRPGQDGGGQQWRPGDNRPWRPDGDNRPWRPGDNTRPGGDWWSQHHPSHIPDRDRWNDWRDHSHGWINDNWHDHWHDHDHWFGNDWWDDHPHFHYHFNPGVNWWAYAAWPAVTTWVNPAWTQPIYYNYGENVYYDQGQVYYGDQAYASAADYAIQAEQIATTPPAVEPAPDDWMPLGVFALTQDGQSTGVEPTLYLQLAVSKQGVLAGSLQNTATGSVQSIEGAVDEATQRAAWTVSGQTRPIMETGLGNLTQETAPALIHFADGTTQQWLLVRLDQPQQEAQGARIGGGAAPPQ
jgi:hypothetical protein